ncbi:FliM/FliN family flagellar motor switch protein [Burkholderia gladioli]|uniref:FliM/FliN family flagellar motor switch protein n=1 Tax=Burkholderia gladioli TaxID=28095 RepID=UPI00164231BD|nr:FliM/FliN family flagellar motor C-terminal domain-containing protein [Burkholderia gladioli]
MNARPVSWRPASDDDAALAIALFEPALAGWQARWFVQPAFVFGAVTRLPGGDALAVGPERIRHDCAAGLRLDLLAAGPRLLAGAAYAMDSSVFDAPASHDALAGIAAGIRDDLLVELGASVSAGQAAVATAQGSTSFSGHGALAITIETRDGKPLAVLVCDIHHIWRRHASTAASQAAAHRGSATLTPRREALDTTPVALSVLLGRCELSAAQLTTLSPGDIIVLDRLIEQPATLVVDASASPIAFGTPGRSATSLSFKLTSLATPDSP